MQIKSQIVSYTVPGIVPHWVTTITLNVVYVLALLLMFLPRGAFSASFDCGKARTQVEKFICTRPSLSELDDAVHSSYIAAKKRGDADTVTSQQRAWLKERNACATPGCIERLYNQRMKELGEKREASPVPAKGKTNSQLITIETETRLLHNQLEILRTIIKHSKYLTLEPGTGNSYDYKKRDPVCKNIQSTLIKKDSVIETPLADFSTGKDGNQKILDVLQTRFSFLKQANLAKSDLERYAQSNWKPVQDLLIKGKAPNSLVMDAFLYHFKGLEREYVLQWYLVSQEDPSKALYAGRIEFDKYGSPMVFAYIDKQVQKSDKDEIYIPRKEQLQDYWVVMTCARVNGKIQFIDVYRGFEEYYQGTEWKIINTTSEAHVEHPRTKREGWYLLMVYSPLASVGILDESSNFNLAGRFVKWPASRSEASTVKYGFLGKYSILPNGIFQDRGWRDDFSPGHYLCEFSYYYPFSNTKGVK